MFKLSRKGWNNVIIVVVLIVITLLHRLEQAQQENSAKRARPLLPESAVVLTWRGPSWQIERPAGGPHRGVARLAAAPRRARARHPGDPQDLDRRTERSGGSRALSGRRQVCRPAALLDLAQPESGAIP